MTDSYDLVLAGTGFASSFFLKKYLEHPSSTNKRVLVLERGVFHSLQSRLRNKNGELDLSILRPWDTYTTDSTKPWIFDPNFGGSSNCWTGCTPRFLPNDFRMKSLYGIGTDWPIQYEDLEPSYTEAESLMAIAGPAETPFPKSGPYPQPPHALSSVDKLFQEKYGNLYISQPAARASVAINQRAMCCSSGVCNLCPVNSKFTIENTLMALYEDSRVTLRYSAQVISLDTSGGMASAIRFLENGKEQKVRADSFVLGTNAIFNAHILLNSGDSNPLTGAGISEQTGIFGHFYYDGLENLGGGSIISANGYMMYDGPHRTSRPACLIEHFNTPIIRNERGKWRQLSLFKFIFEDLPDDNNRVITTGDPRMPEIVYGGLGEYVKAGLKELPSLIEKYFSFLPVESWRLDDAPQPTEYHICSTARMGTDPGNSVVDASLVHHEYRNVLVLGSSAFPTVTPANPTLTLSALSINAANHYLA